MQNAGLDESQAGIKIAGRDINNLRYADDTSLLAESEEELKSPLMRVKEESEKAGFKLNLQKTKIMAFNPITSWQIGGKTWQQWQILFSLALKPLWTVIAATKLKDACSLEEKLWRTEEKLWQKLWQCMKSRDIILPTKVHTVKAMVFPVFVYGCESWTLKKAENQRTDAFEL